MVSQRGGAIIQHLLRRLLLKVVREDLKTTALREKTRTIQADATAEFVAGGLFGLLMWWMSGKMRVSVDEVDRLFRGLAISAVKAVA